MASVRIPARRCLRAGWIVLVTLLLATLGAAPAQAIDTPGKYLPVAQLLPADGHTQMAGSKVDFFLGTRGPLEVDTWPFYSDYAALEVSTQSYVGRDGTLSDDFVVGRDHFVERSAAVPSLYAARTYETAWQNTPGTYYWQFFINYWSIGCSPCLDVTPVRSITITPAPQPAPAKPAPVKPAPPKPAPGLKTPAGGHPADDIPWLSPGAAKGYARAGLRKSFGRSYQAGKKQRIRCTKVGYTRASCRVSWTYKTWTYKGRIKVWDEESDYFIGWHHHSYRIVRHGSPCTGKSCKRVYSKSPSEG